jgi:hypothetical protein
MLSSLKQAALEVLTGSASSVRPWTERSGRFPRQKPPSPKRLPFRHKTNLLREISGYKRLGQIFSAGDDVQRQIFGSSHLIEAFHAMQLTGRALRNRALRKNS